MRISGDMGLILCSNNGVVNIYLRFLHLTVLDVETQLAVNYIEAGLRCACLDIFFKVDLANLWLDFWC